MKKRRMQLCSKPPYLSPAPSPRQLSPDPPSLSAKPAGCYSDSSASLSSASLPSWNCFSASSAQQHSPPSSSSSSVVSYRHKTPATATVATAPSPSSSTTTSTTTTTTSTTTTANMASSRPPSIAALAAANRPTLHDILSNTAPPPWTLGAFMAYLSQNHCLETLEFTMEAERYRSAFGQVQLDEGEADAARWSHDARDYMLALWRKLINAYILPCGPREVNLPGPVRDRLLAMDRHPNSAAAAATVPPHPAELDEAVQIVYELMNDSVLLAFVDSVNAEQQHQQTLETQEQLQQRQQLQQLQQIQQLQYMQHMQQIQQAASEGSSDSDDMMDARQGRSRRRTKDRTGAPSAASGSSSSSTPRRKDGSRSPKPSSSFLPQLALGRRQRSSSPSSPSSSSIEGLEAAAAATAAAYYGYDTVAAAATAATLHASPEPTLPSRGPLTPPTTPPTSDWNLSTSPTHISINDSNGNSSSSGGSGSGGLQRALTAHNAGWKRVSAKLGLGGLNRVGRTSRPRLANTSSGEAGGANTSPTAPTAPSSGSLAPAYGDSDVAMGGVVGQAL